jgi:hypothetical protein
MTTSDRDLRRAKFDLVLDRKMESGGAMEWFLPAAREQHPQDAQINYFKNLSSFMKQGLIRKT